MAECAVCGQPTDNTKYWGRYVCEECSGLPVLFVARCERGDCRWSTSATGTERRKGEAKQAIQRDCNNHKTRHQIIKKEQGHTTECREMEHPDRVEGGR